MMQTGIYDRSVHLANELYLYIIDNMCFVICLFIYMMSLSPLNTLFSLLFLFCVLVHKAYEQAVMSLGTHLSRHRLVCPYT